MGIQRELKQTRPFATVEQETVLSVLRTADLVRRTLAAIIEPEGITLQQYNVLRILRGAGDAGLPTLEIAQRLVEQTPGVTRLMDRLEAKDLVGRERCRTDRRQVFCRITPAGVALLDRLEAPIRAAEAESLETLTPKQLRQLVSLLDLARNGLHAALAARRVELTEEAS